MAKTTQKDALKWLTLAAATEDSRPSLTWAYADATHTASADGYTLHVIADVLPNENGWIHLPKSVPDGNTFQFANWRHALPASSTLVLDASVYPEDITKAVKRAMVFAKYDANRVYLAFKPSAQPEHEPSILSIIGKCAEYGDCETFIDVHMSDSPAHTMALNGHYLLDAISGFETGISVTLRLYASGILTVGDLDSRYAVIMPMVINRDGDVFGEAPTVAQPGAYVQQRPEDYMHSCTPCKYPYREGYDSRNVDKRKKAKKAAKPVEPDMTIADTTADGKQHTTNRIVRGSSAFSDVPVYGVTSQAEQANALLLETLTALAREANAIKVDPVRKLIYLSMPADRDWKESLGYIIALGTTTTKIHEFWRVKNAVSQRPGHFERTRIGTFDPCTLYETLIRRIQPIAS